MTDLHVLFFMGLDTNFDFHSGSQMFKSCHVLENEDQDERGKYGVREDEWDTSRIREI
jgi:hypothetical protein